MADDFWARKRKEEEAEERRLQDDRDRVELEARRRKKAAGPTSSNSAAAHLDIPAGTDSERLSQLIELAVPLIEQVNQLYIRYASGEQARPPIELRGRLDAMISLMTNISKGSPADRFRFSTILASHQTHKTRWEKLLADVETGKIKRTVGSGPRRR